MNVWGITHRGAVRHQNQDAFSTRTLEDGRIIALVCDGMGGARAGNVASSMAVELFMEDSGFDREWFTTVGADDGITYTTRETDTPDGKHIEIVPDEGQNAKP